MYDRKGYEDDGLFWTDAHFVVTNDDMNFTSSTSCFEFAELEYLNSILIKLLNDQLNEIEILTFYEPYLEVVLKPKFNKIHTGRYSYVSDDNDIEDVKADFRFIYCRSGAPTEQYYSMPLYRADIIEFSNYMTDIIGSLK